MGTEGALIGRTIGGRFTITEFLAEGGMGSIYRGTCAEEPGGVAIKLMSVTLAQKTEFVKRFRREVKTLTRLRHRSMVRIVDHGMHDGRPFLAMELIAGLELHQLLDHEPRLSEARAVRMMAQICSALAAAHDLGVVHRDLKPENIMILRDPSDPTIERVKVLDFGIAKIMTPELCTTDALPTSSDGSAPSSTAGELTKIGTLIGTPDFMAPEQFRGEPVDARTDLYACGLLLQLLITGCVPLVADDWVGTSRLRMQETAPRLTELVPGTHEKLAELVASSLCRDATVRPQSAREMQQRLLAMMPDLAEVTLPLQAVPSARRAAGDAKRVAYSQTLPSGGAAEPAAAGELVPVDAETARVLERAPPGVATTPPAAPDRAVQTAPRRAVIGWRLVLAGAVALCVSILVLVLR